MKYLLSVLLLGLSLTAAAHSPLSSSKETSESHKKVQEQNMSGSQDDQGVHGGGGG